MIRVFEVGPRDGLQNEAVILTVDQRLDLIEGLLKAGLEDIEVGAFVRPDRIPQMAGTDDLFRSDRFRQLQKLNPHARFWSLVPNEKGLDRAIQSGARAIAVFGGATETFVQKNIGMSIEQSLQAFRRVVKRAYKNGMMVRGYISVCWICPYEGDVKPEAVLRVLQPMLDMGIPAISLGDTIGRAHPHAVDALLQQVLEAAPAESFGVHFHDTYGMALANIDHGIRMGITTIDSSVGGLGGCPYAPGAAGNVVTEDVDTLLAGYRLNGIPAKELDAEALLQTALLAQQIVGHPLPSRRLRAWLSTRR